MRPGKTEPGRGQEATGEGSLDPTKGFPEAPLRSPKGHVPSAPHTLIC